LKQLLPAQSANSQNMSKCHPILESLSINAPVVGLYFDPKQVIAVFFVHIQINIAHRNKEKYLVMLKVDKASES
jgi:hypothetical protein